MLTWNRYQEGACQFPGDAKCFSASSAPIGFTGSACCEGSKCLPWVEPGANLTGSEDWYCQYSDPLPDNAQCVCSNIESSRMVTKYFIPRETNRGGVLMALHVWVGCVL